MLDPVCVCVELVSSDELVLIVLMRTIVLDMVYDVCVWRTVELNFLFVCLLFERNVYYMAYEDSVRFDLMLFYIEVLVYHISLDVCVCVG